MSSSSRASKMRGCSIARHRGMSISITKDRTLEAFAIVVDINDFGRTVTSAEEGATKGADIADFTKDALDHVIRAIEENEGEVAAIMGDAVFGLIPEGAPILTVCDDIAVAVNRESEHISEHRVISPGDWAYSPGGVSLKICIEFGKLRVTSVKTRYLGNQPLFVRRCRQKRWIAFLHRRVILLYRRRSRGVMGVM